MKRMFSLFGMAAMMLLLTVSCKKEENNGMKTVKFSAKIEQVGDKHYIYLPSHTQFWNLGDEILVNGIKLKATSVDNPEHHQGYSEFEGMIPEEYVFKAPYYAVYPSNSNMFIYQGEATEGWTPNVDHCVEFEFKNEQSYVENSFDPQAAIMASTTYTGNQINFQSFYNLLQFDLYSSTDSPLAISKLKFTSKIYNDEEKTAFITGKATYNQTSGAVKEDAQTLGRFIVLNCSESVTIPAESSEARPFIFVIPTKCKMGGFTLDVYTENSETPYATIESNNSVTITEQSNILVHFQNVAVPASNQPTKIAE